MVERQEGVLELAAEANELSNKLSCVLKKLWRTNREVARPINKEVLAKVAEPASDGVALEDQTAQDMAGASTLAEHINVAPNINVEGFRSFFSVIDVNPQETKTRNRRSALVVDVVLAFLFANENINKTVYFESIFDELNRLNLKEDKNTTYARISRLREEPSFYIAPSDPDNKYAYFLTDTGRAYVTKMLLKRRLVAPVVPTLAER